MRVHVIALVLALVPLRVQSQAAVRVSAYADVERTVEHALELQAGGSYTTAASLLQEAAAQCTNLDDDQGRCTHLLYFSLGYICQREAARAGADSSLLDLAVMYYERVLRASDGAADPVVGDAAYNLALLFRTLEPHESQEAFYRRAPELDPPRAALYLTFLGDYLVRTDRQDEARRAYRAAAQADPDDPAPRAGLLDTYRQVGGDDAQVLLRLGEDWEPRFPDIAAQAYRMAIDAAHRTRSPLAEEALLRHVRLMASRDARAPAVIAQLSRDWPPVAMLEAFYESPSNARTRASWWLDTRERAQILARVALAIGQQHVAAGRPAAAESYWTAARMFADAGTAEALDLKRELALLYVRHDSLDPGNRKFDELERELFAEKGGVLAARDLEAAQRYHTVLGQIYAMRGTWESTRRGWNAIDQLSWALQAAEQREAGGHVRQPLPELRMLLARGHEATARGGGPGLYLQAAADYIDVDDLPNAAVALELAPATQRAALKRLLNYRHALATGEGAARCRADEIATAARGVASLGESFMARQHFRILSDCLDIVPAAQRPALAAEAMTLMVDGDVSLIGSGDLLRLEKATSAVRERATWPDYEAHVDFAPHGGGRHLRALLSTDTRLGYLPVQQDALIAANVIRLMRGAAGYRFQVRDGVVTFDYDPDNLLTRYRGDITRVDGVRSVERRQY
jgi:hypothetical protein